MRKAQIPLGMIFGIILFLILLIASISWAKGLFRLSQQASDDFYKLDALIKEVASSNIRSIESIPYRLDQGTALVFFNKDSKETEIDIRRFGLIKIEKPQECTKNCMCLCQEIDSRGELAYFCSRKICITDYDLGIQVATSQICSEQNNLVCIKSTKGGFIIDRKFQAISRDIALYVQKIGQDEIAICNVLDDRNNCKLPQSSGATGGQSGGAGATGTT